MWKAGLFMKEKFLSVLLVICMISSLVPFSVWAADADLTISDEDGLKAFAQEVNNGNDYAGKTVVLTNGITLTGEWTPIGSGIRSGSSYTGNAFKGIFDGDNHTISGLTISSTSSADAVLGLFGVVDGGTVKNLKLTNVNISVSDSELAGGAVGILTGGGVADNIEVSGSVSAKRGNGGIVGRMLISGTISNCVNNALLSATGANVGGIVGAAYYTEIGKTMTISGCTNNGSVSSSSSGVGGIVGLSAANISNCSNTAEVNGGGYSVGGIVGEQQNYGSIIGCTNSADVSVASGTDSGNYGTGGIVGWIRYSGSSSDYPMKGIVEVKDNTNSGRVTGASDAGGIVGTVYHAANVSGNANTATDLSATNFAAGIVGNFQFSDSYWGDPIPEKELILQNNISTTALDNISAACKDLYAYDNSSGSQDGTIDNNSDAWVAQVGSDKYATLQAAIDAADGKTIVVLSNIDLGGDTVTISAGKAVTLDLNGNVISGVCNSNGASMIVVENTADLTIKDSSEPSIGKITYAPGTNDTGFELDVKGDLILESGTIELTGSWTLGFAVDVRPNSWGSEYTEWTTFVMEGGKIVSSDTAVRVASSSSDQHENVSASFTMNDGEINSTWDAVFIHHWSACDYDININGGIVEGDNSALRIYGETAINDIDLTITDGIILGELKNLGTTGNGKTSISGGTYSDNDAVSYLEEGYTLATYVKDGETVYGVEPVYTVTIDAPEGATIVVKDADDEEVNADTNGTYKLVNGTYTYIVSRSGYETATGSFIVNGGNKTVDVNLDLITYTVTYMDGDTVLFTETVAHGADASLPSIPEKEGYNQIAPYWNTDGKNITEDAVISAVYTINKYTVTYKADNEVIVTIEVKHGENVAFPKVPKKDGYVGKWDRNNENITSDTLVNAIYTEIANIVPDEVKPEDKTELEDTKKQLEEMLNDNGYTEDDKNTIQDAINNIDDALKVIANVEAVEDRIDRIPNNITKDDEATIKAADDAYNALTDYEKSLVDEDAKKTLNNAKAALTELNKPISDPDSPQTGDNSNLWMWLTLLLVSAAGVIGLTIYELKRKGYAGKYIR